MKKIYYLLIFLILNYSTGNTQNLGFKIGYTKTFEKNYTNGFEFGSYLNYSIKDKFLISPNMGLYVLNAEIVTKNSYITKIEKGSKGIFFIGTGFYYKLIESNNFLFYTGPCLKLVYFDEFKPIFANKMTVPWEFRFQSELDFLIAYSLSKKVGLNFYTSVGYIQNTRLKENVDYPENISELLKPMTDFMIFQVGIGIVFDITKRKNNDSK